MDGAWDYERAAEIFRMVRASGRTVRKMNDFLIAAVAERRGARVVHRDVDLETIASVIPLQTLDLRPS